MDPDNSIDIRQELDTIKRLLIISAKSVWDVNECALVLGVTPGRIYHLASNREIPHYRCGRQLRFRREEIEGYQCRNRVPTSDELRLDAQRYILTKNYK